MAESRFFLASVGCLRVQRVSVALNRPPVGLNFIRNISWIHVNNLLLDVWDDN